MLVPLIEGQREYCLFAHDLCSVDTFAVFVSGQGSPLSLMYVGRAVEYLTSDDVVVR